jgi:hypothetical protein
MLTKYEILIVKKKSILTSFSIINANLVSINIKKLMYE